jgi:hypothetical protein
MQKPVKPFFSRFLSEQELRQVNGGGDVSTTKFPSDSDDDVQPPRPDKPPIFTTQKFPSDSDESGV